MTLTGGERCLVGAQVLVSPFIDVLVMVHKTGNTMFFLSGLLTRVISLRPRRRPRKSKICYFSIHEISCQWKEKIAGINNRRGEPCQLFLGGETREAN